MAPVLSFVGIVLSFALGYFGLKLLPGTLYIKHRRLAQEFATAYQTALETKPTRFDDLPVMPLWTPYYESWSGINGYRTRFNAKAFEPVDIDAFLDAFIAEFSETTRGEVATMRAGDCRDADALLGPQGATAKQALCVKATKTKGELAIVAVEIAEAMETWQEDEYGNKRCVFDLNVDETGAKGKKCVLITVATSFWPKSAWPGEHAGVLGLAMPGTVSANTYERSKELWFFKPKSWLTKETSSHEKLGVPDFEEKTGELAETLTRTADGVLKRLTENLRALGEDAA
ncbi:MAG: hypothetical protein J6K20_14385 [Thermoguttaceae bacterium]|nr:hypothetical protein [Thermoguttaceae bacterium]